MLPPPLFRTSDGKELRGISPARHAELLTRLGQELKLLPGYLAESASFSMAMVVRSALGLSAHEGKVLVMVTDSLSGLIASATLRHLVNAGADGMLVATSSGGPLEPELQRHLDCLDACGIPAAHLDDFIDSDPEKFLDLCHNVIWGLHGHSFPRSNALVDLLNEHSIPIHGIQCPEGLDPETGQAGSNPLYASSTLSLGLPFAGLFRGHDFVGRHYVADISFPRHFFAEGEAPSMSLFAAQPVVQIFPVPAEESKG